MGVDECQKQSHNTDYTNNKKNMDFTDDKKTGRNGEKGSFEVRKLGRWEKRKEIANEPLRKEIK